MSERSDMFKEELAGYISARKRKKFSLKGIFSISPRIKPYKEDKASKLEDVAKQADLEEAAESLEKEYEEEKEGWISRILEATGIKRKKEPAGEEEYFEDPLLDDMKSLAKISLKLVKTLPTRALEEFKESQEFSRFKEILKKHKLIR